MFLDFRRFLLVSPTIFRGAMGNTPWFHNVETSPTATSQRTNGPRKVVSEKTLLLRWTGRAVTWRAMVEAMLGEFDPRCCRRFLYVHPDS